jgi:DNA-binding NarL/FixJ family response regulator
VLCRHFRDPHNGNTRASNDADRASAAEDRPVQRTVLIVDDHEAFRVSARLMLESEGFHVVGEAADGADAIAQAGRLRPAIVLLDVQLPDLDGFAVAAELVARPQPPIVVLISSRDAASYARRMARTAARGFIAKADLTGASLAALVA